MRLTFAYYYSDHDLRLIYNDALLYLFIVPILGIVLYHDSIDIASPDSSIQ